MERFKKEVFSFLKEHRKQIKFYLFLNFIFVFCITLSSYIRVPVSGFKDRFLYISHLILMQLSIVGYLYISTLNKWLIRFVFFPCFFVLCLFSYWVYTQDISVTQSLIQAIFETKASISLELLSTQFMLFFVLILILIFLINRAYSKIAKIKVNTTFFIIALISFFCFGIVESKRANTLKSRLPYNVFYGIKEYLQKDEFIILDNIPKNIYCINDSLKIVLVLGETVRADHLKLNGYIRDTNPLLRKRVNLVSFNNIFTPHTYTATSLPRIISNASVNSKELNHITSVFNVFNKSNYNTLWIGNQELETSFESLVRTNKNVILIDSLRSVLSFKKALDEKILEPFRTNFLKANRNGLFTLHMMGSHWWYENRYTEKYRKYKPVIDSKHIPSLSKQEIINSYDNTILYLDNFLNEVIKTQESSNTPTIMIYISDHGEALGERGKWLHAQKVKAIANPAMIVWYSNEFEKKYPLKTEAIKKNKNKYFTTDIVYHSLLDLLEVKNIDYKKEQSIFRTKE